MAFFILDYILGSVEVTRILLEAGADKSKKNDIGRTATQLGAFTGKRQ